MIIVNHSINGNTTRLALERAATDLQGTSPTIVYVQFGLNDANFWVSDRGLPRVSMASFRANLVEIAARARRAGAREVIFGTNHLTQVDGPVEQKKSPVAMSSYRDNVIAYNQLVREACQDAGANLIDIERAWISKIEQHGSSTPYLADDGLHLSALGNEFYFGETMPHLQRVIEQAN